MKPRLILVGGFLGAGKTTLIAEAAQRLISQGKRVGLITNDQAPNLVDTELLSKVTADVSEVSGSCFCCNFPGLLNAMDGFRQDIQPDVLLAEPVGSCTDLSATIVQPLKDLGQSDYEVAPLSVLVDPARLGDVLKGGNGGLHPSAAYIYRKQIEEADFIVVTKTDQFSEPEIDRLVADAAADYPLARIFRVSSLTGDGLQEWLDAVLLERDSGKQLATVDYDVYAEGEAVLGWLNATYRLLGDAVNWDEFSRRLLASLAIRFDSQGAPVGHVKLMIEAGGTYAVANLTGNAATLRFRGTEVVGGHARLTLNARVEMSPALLEQIVNEEIAAACGNQVTSTALASRCLSPGRPEPTHRYDRRITIS